MMVTTTKRKGKIDRLADLSSEDAHALLELIGHAAQHEEGFIPWLVARTLDPANLPDAGRLLMKKGRGEALAMLSEMTREDLIEAALREGDPDEHITIIIDGERMYCPPASIARQIRAAEKMYEAKHGATAAYMPCHRLPDPNEAKTNSRKRKAGKGKGA